MRFGIDKDTSSNADKSLSLSTLFFIWTFKIFMSDKFLKETKSLSEAIIKVPCGITSDCMGPG
jgi:hypothetical protein